MNVNMKWEQNGVYYHVIAWGRFCKDLELCENGMGIIGCEVPFFFKPACLFFFISSISNLGH